MTATTQFETLLTAADLKEQYLFGVDFKDDNGNVMSDNAISAFLKRAISAVEHELDISIMPIEHSGDNAEERDYRLEDFYSWSYIKTNCYPIIELLSYKIQFPSNNELVDYPSTWFKVNKDSGIIQLLPEASTSAVFTQEGLFLPYYILNRKMVPQMIVLEYISGFEDGKIPAAINQAIALKASIDILSILGDLVVGAGIAQSTISADGLSQSVGTTASATYGAYSARMLDYSGRLKDLMKTLREYYKGIPMVTI